MQGDHLTLDRQFHFRYYPTCNATGSDNKAAVGRIVFTPLAVFGADYPDIND